MYPVPISNTENIFFGLLILKLIAKFCTQPTPSVHNAAAAGLLHAKKDPCYILI